MDIPNDKDGIMNECKKVEFELILQLYKNIIFLFKIKMNLNNFNEHLNVSDIKLC